MGWIAWPEGTIADARSWRNINFKSYNDGISSLEGKSNKTGIRYKLESNSLDWNGLYIQCQTRLNDYEIAALRDKICYCRIIRKFVRSKYKYSLQLVLEGRPPIKINKEGGVKNYIGYGDILSIYY